jgi:hypothetical protein
VKKKENKNHAIKGMPEKPVDHLHWEEKETESSSLCVLSGLFLAFSSKKPQTF